MKSGRKPTSDEMALITLLVERASISPGANWKETILVEAMNDGGMGSLKLYPEGMIKERNFGECVSEYQFKDSDGVDVIASLYLDTEGELYELDMWKTDFGRLIAFPKLS